MKDEGGRMKESKGLNMQSVNEALAFAHDFSFFISYSSSFILHPSSLRNPSFNLS